MKNYSEDGCENPDRVGGCNYPDCECTAGTPLPRCAVCGDHGCEFCPAARRQQIIDRLEAPEQVPVWDEAGTVNVRLLAGVAALAIVAVIVWLAWPYLVGLGVTFMGYRVVTRGTKRRRRARSSWSSLGRTAAAMFAAWNTRYLVRRNGRQLRVSVPAAAGRAHVDEYGPVDDGYGTVPF